MKVAMAQLCDDRTCMRCDGWAAVDAAVVVVTRLAPALTRTSSSVSSASSLNSPPALASRALGHRCSGHLPPRRPFVE